MFQKRRVALDESNWTGCLLSQGDGVGFSVLVRDRVTDAQLLGMTYLTFVRRLRPRHDGPVHRSLAKARSGFEQRDSFGTQALIDVWVPLAHHWTWYYGVGV